MESYSYVERNFLSLKEDIEKISRSAGRQCPILVCVTKSADDGEVLSLLASGASDIAENRPQMFAARHKLAADNGYGNIRMHLIGSLQTNKVKLVVPFAELIHSLDSDKLARHIDAEAGAEGKTTDVLIEINSSRETQKGGVLPEDAEKLAELVRSLPNIRLRGVMTMGAFSECEEDYRAPFRTTAAVCRKMLLDGFVEGGEPVISMGMSGSYRVAIEEGATIIRVGRKLFCKETGNV